MPTAKFSGLALQLGRFAPDGHPAADGELLARFVATRDEPAFAELVRRYGRLVFAVCRRVTGSHHLAEDAFQAVFVVLAAKAACVRPAAALPAWLHAVATRTALRARTVADRRRRRETPVESLPDAEEREGAPAADADLAAVVDEEIARLPDALRAAVVLCEMEGCSRKDAAARLGVPEGTVSSRLAAARKALAARLRSRGIALSAAGLSAALGSHATARVPAALTARALASAMSPGVVPAAVAALSTGVLRIMFAQKLKAVLALATVALAALACAAVAASHDPPVPQPPAPKPAAVFALRFADPPPPKAAPKPLPKGPNKLLFTRDGRLTLIDPDGKNETKLDEADGKRHPAHVGLLSPDGTAVAILVLGTLPPDDGTPGAKRAPMSLHVRKLDEKEPGTDLGVQCQTFVWSPDGTEVACTEFEDGGGKPPETTHFVVNVKTKAKTALKLSSGHFISDWSRDGKFFLTTSFAGTLDNRLYRMHLMNRDGTEHKSLTDKTQNALMGRLSPDGTRVLYSTWTNAPKDKPASRKLDLSVLDIATGKTNKVEDVPLNAELQQGYCWSPDGKKIAYTWREVHEGKPEDVMNKETESHLIVCDPDGKNAKTIASEKGKGPGQITLAGVDWR